jgi:protein-S-isoprenylcysteine O-methyltransferase Ste14
MRLRVSSTSTRTFALFPAAVLAEQALARRPLRPRWVPLMLWGYLQYRLAGTYRIRRAGGPPGLSQGYPERVITTGIYAFTRNPMYLGHQIWLVGLALVTGSPVAVAALPVAAPWFDRRATHDEQRLAERFGRPYAEYRDRVPRWVGRRATAPGGQALERATT